MTFGHLAFSYLLIKLMQGLGGVFSWMDIMAIMVAGSMLDLDIIGSLWLKRGVSHHRFFTHTPAGIFLLWLIFVFLIQGYFSWMVLLVALAAAWSHLVLDSLGGWIVGTLPGLENYGLINWAYPWRRRLASLTISRNLSRLNRSYLKADAINKDIELVLMLAALVVFLQPVFGELFLFL